MEPTTFTPPQQHGGTYKFPSAFTLFGRSLHIIGHNILPVLGLTLLPLAIGFGLFILLTVALVSMSTPDYTSTTTIDSINSDTAVAVKTVIMIAAIVLLVIGSFILNAALTVVFLKGAREEKITLGQSLKQGVRYAWRLFVLELAVGFLILIGFILLIVPGVFMIKRYVLAPFYLIDRNLGVLAAMRQSAEDSKRFSGPVWGLVGVNFLLAFASMFPFGSIIQLLYIAAPAARYAEIDSATTGHGHHPAQTHGHGHMPAAPIVPQVPSVPYAPQPPAPTPPADHPSSGRPMF